MGLLAAGGPDAVSTRAVSAAAGVQPPTIYRLFGDKQGLLEAMVVRGFTEYLNGKEVDKLADPVADLRVGWDQHVMLGLANPSLYRLMYASGATTPAAVAAFRVLAERVARIARVGRLSVPESRAVALIHAAGHGTTLTLIATPEADRDPELSVTAREAVLAAITTDAPAPQAREPVVAAVTLRAVLPQVSALTEPEKALMAEWLDRIAADHP